MAVEEAHELGQVFRGEIVCPHAGIKTWQAKKDGVCSISDGGTGALPVSSRGEKFREVEGARHGRDELEKGKGDCKTRKDRGEQCQGRRASNYDRIGKMEGFTGDDLKKWRS